MVVMFGRCDSRGFGLLEVLVSAALVIVVAAGLAQLIAVAVDATRTSARDSVALLLAVQKMEQLRSLPWREDTFRRRRVSDLTTDMTSDPPGPSGGVGLSTSSRQSLGQSVVGYVDYLDSRGRWVGTGSRPTPGASFVRRWSVRQSRLAPADLLVLEVAVVPARLAAETDWTRLPTSPPGVVWLSTFRVRD